MEITGVWTKQNILDVTTEFKELLSDKTIKSSTTEARAKYAERVKAVTRNKRYK